ncbi:hypothetical protein B0H13DRAFT_1850137 [Mycena leptocephala]|nr:hypothetical protein B0H13DRAFT_1850137 [Mycena leptocephala]
MDLDGVLRGDVEFPISHAGGEFEEEMREDLKKAKSVFLLVLIVRSSWLWFRRRDPRLRKDVIARRVLGFRGQMGAITAAYIKWGSTQGQYGLDSPGAPPVATNEAVDGWYCIKVVDLLSVSQFLSAREREL